MWVVSGRVVYCPLQTETCWLEDWKNSVASPLKLESLFYTLEKYYPGLRKFSPSDSMVVSQFLGLLDDLAGHPPPWLSTLVFVLVVHVSCERHTLQDIVPLFWEY